MKHWPQWAGCSNGYHGSMRNNTLSVADVSDRLQTSEWIWYGRKWSHHLSWRSVIVSCLTQIYTVEFDCSEYYYIDQCTLFFTRPVGSGQPQINMFSYTVSNRIVYNNYNKQRVYGNLYRPDSASCTQRRLTYYSTLTILASQNVCFNPLTPTVAYGYSYKASCARPG